MVSGKRPKYQQKRILGLSFLFTIKYVASGYSLSNIENFFSSSTFSLKSGQRSIPDKLKYRKKMSLSILKV